MTKFALEFNTRDFDATMDRWSDDVENEIVKALQESASALNGEYVKAIQRGARSGIIYPPIKGRRGKPHQASAPGEPPKTDMGELAQSFFMAVDRPSLTMTVGNAAPHAGPLEFKPASKGGRPFMGPIFEDNLVKIVERMVRAYKTATRKTGGL